MSDALAVHILGTILTFAVAVLVMMNPDQFMPSFNGNPVRTRPWRRLVARVALLCWAWPIMLLVAVGYGLLLLCRAAR